MKQEFCPNKKSKEFKELSEIFGEDKAYFLWMRNKGNPLDKAPNGTDSKLFNSLLDYYEGDRRKALEAKEKTYRNEFLRWFGDWIGITKIKFYGATMGKTTAAKTNKKLVDFDDVVRDQVKNLAEKQGKTVKQLKTEGGPEYKQLLLDAIETWKTNPNNEGKTLVISNAVLAKEYVFDNTPSLPSKKEFVKRLIGRGEGSVLEAELYYDDLVSKWMPEDFDVEDKYVLDIESREDFGEVSKVVDENGEPILAYHTVNSDYNADIRIFNTEIEGRKTMIYSTDDYKMSQSYVYAKRNRVTSLLEMREFLDRKIHELQKSEEYIKKISNPTLGHSDKEIRKLGYSSKDDPDFITMRDYTIKSAYLDRARDIADIQWAEFVLSVPESIKYTKPFFVNIKHPFVVEGDNLNWDQLTIDDNIDPAQVVASKKRIKKRYYELYEKFEKLAVDNGKVDGFMASVLSLEEIDYTLHLNIIENINRILLKEFGSEYNVTNPLLKTRDIEDFYLNNDLYDGIIFKDVVDYGGFIPADITIGHNVFASKRSDQMKHIENRNGEYAGPNIYHNLKTKTPNSVYEIKTALENILRDYYSFRRNLGLSIPKKYELKHSKRDENVLKLVEQAFGFPEGTLYFKDDSSTVYINIDKISSNIDQFRNKLNHSNVKSALEKIKLVLFLASKIEGLSDKVTFVESSKWSGRMKDGRVYLNLNASLDIAAEECLHPFIEMLFDQNKDLFNKLLKEAQREFKTLRIEIAQAYKNATPDDRKKELVTQALARHFSEVYEENNALKENKSIWRKAWDWILHKLGIGEIKRIKYISLRQLAEAIFKANNIVIPEIYFSGEKFNLNETVSDSENISNNINTRREEYISSVVEQYKQSSKLEGEALTNALLKVKDNARKQFDLDEIGRLKTNKELSDKDKQIVLSLLYRDLEIVTGLQHTESIEKDLDEESFETIKEGTRTRLRSHLNRTTKQTTLINELKDQLAQMENIDPKDIDETFKLIELFLINAEQEILKTRRFIDEQLVGKDISTWDPQLINYIRYDLLGYYDGILSQLYKLFTNESKIGELNKLRAQKALELSALSDEEKQNLSKEDQEAMYARDLFDLTTSLQRVVDSMQQDYQDKVAIPYAKKILTDFAYESDAVKDKETFIRNMVRWIELDTVYGDLAVGELALGMASRSRSSVINIVEKMMSDIEFEKNREILKEGNELIRLYNKVRPAGSQMDFRNFQKLFMEMDGEDGTDGKFTGYFVRDRNYGKFYKDKDAFEATLREKYSKKGLKWRYNEYNDSYDLIFPEEDHTADNSVYNQYYDELDEWLDQHCERRYKLEYYKKKRRFLSPAALLALQLIQHQIDILANKGMTEDGFIDSSKLTQTERQRLADLRKEKRELACPYIFSSLSDGTVTLKEKQGEDAEIAKQITNWNRYIADHVKYKLNDAKFNAALSKFEKDSPEYKLFLADNRIQIINPEFWKYVLRNAPKQTLEYRELAERHRAIVEHLKRRGGFTQPDLDLLGMGINTDTSAWEELKRLELQMEELKVRPEELQEREEYTTAFLVSSTKETDKKFLNWLGERWNYEIDADASNAEKFRQLFTYTDYKGRQRYLKVFKMVSPTSFNIKKEDGESIPTTIYQYSSLFSELDESSDFVNTKYKKEIKFSMLPKIRKAGTKRVQGSIDYTNDNYQKILENEGYKQLYDKLIELMEKANSMIPSKALERRFLLPQITGRGMSILGRSRSSADLFASLNYGLQDWTGLKFGKDGKPEFDDSLMLQDTDVSTNWDLPRRPDGTIVNNIPIRFVKRLLDPSIISSDVLGSVLLYYDMALNYKIKSEKLPAFELIQEAINPNTKSRQSSKNKLPKQYLKMKQLMDYRIYGKESKLGGDDTKTYSKFLKSTMLISKKFRSLASMSMLALNFTTIEVGYLDALLGSIADAVGGKYFTTEDLRKGYWQAFKSLPNVIANLGNPVVEDWMVAAMQYNQLSKSNSDIFGRTDQSRWSRLLSETRMGGYTMADYLINTMILGATYNHYRLVTMPDGKSKKFMSKTDTIDAFTKLGYTEKEAILKWESADITLRLAYYQENGLLKVHKDYEQYITKKLENQIAGRLRDRTAVYNGIIPQTEKAAIQQNVFGSFLTLMRNFYVNTYWERARAGYDYATEEEIESKKFNMYTSDSAGSVNFETGEFGNGLWFSALKGMYKYIQNVKALVTGKDLRQLTSDLKYAVKRILAEVAIIAACAFLMVWSIAFARTNDYDEDKTPAWTVNIFDPEGEDRGILEFNGKNAGDKMLNWTRWKLALLATRTFTERSTFYWPGTVTELISSPSTAKSYLDDLGYSLELFMDLFEINGHDRNEMVRSGGYKGMTRGTRDIMKITGATGIDNVIRNWHTSGIKSTLNWYQGVSPNNFLIPNKSTWEKETGKSSKSKSKLAY